MAGNFNGFAAQAGQGFGQQVHQDVRFCETPACGRLPISQERNVCGPCRTSYEAGFAHGRQMRESYEVGVAHGRQVREQQQRSARDRSRSPKRGMSGNDYRQREHLHQPATRVVEVPCSHCTNNGRRADNHYDHECKYKTSHRRKADHRRFLKAHGSLAAPGGEASGSEEQQQQKQQ